MVEDQEEAMVVAVPAEADMAVEEVVVDMVEAEVVADREAEIRVVTNQDIRRSSESCFFYWNSIRILCKCLTGRFIAGN